MEVSGWAGVCTGSRAGGRRGVPLQLDGDLNTVPTSLSQIPPLVFVQEGKRKQELLWWGCICQLEANNGKCLVLRACLAWSWGESPWELRGAPRNADRPGDILDCSSLAGEAGLKLAASTSAAGGFTAVLEEAPGAFISLPLHCCKLAN